MTVAELQDAVTAELATRGRTARWATLLGQLTTARNAETRAARLRHVTTYRGPATLTTCEETP